MYDAPLIARLIISSVLLTLECFLKACQSLLLNAVLKDAASSDTWRKCVNG